MARYFFDLVSPDGVSADDIGTDLPNAESAYLQAYEAALEMSFEMLRERVDPSRHKFEIIDKDGRRIFDIPFAEVMRPADRRPPPDRKTPHDELHASLQKRHEHAHTVIAELRSDFSRAYALLENTKVLLSKV